MNCGQFQKRLHEYVEGTLSTGARAEAERHLANCDACRQVVRKEQKFAQLLAGSLRRGTETLKLSPEIRQNILMAALRKPAPPTLGETIIGLWRRFAWQAAGAVCVLVVAGLLISHFSRPRISEMGTVRSNDHSRHAALAQRPVVSIQIAYRVPALKFRREGNLVVDTLAYETVVASGTLCPGGQVREQ